MSASQCCDPVSSFRRIHRTSDISCSVAINRSVELTWLTKRFSMPGQSKKRIRFQVRSTIETQNASLKTCNFNINQYQNYFQIKRCLHDSQSVFALSVRRWSHKHDGCILDIRGQITLRLRYCMPRKVSFKVFLFSRFCWREGWWKSKSILCGFTRDQQFRNSWGGRGWRRGWRRTNWSWKYGHMSDKKVTKC